MNSIKTIKTFLVCPGLGNVNRGFEAFAEECFEAISSDPALDLTLFKGGGGSDKGVMSLWNLPREKSAAKLIGKSVAKSGYIVEQATFGLSLLPHLTYHKPDVVMLSDFCLAHYLWHWRKRTNGTYKILFSNGGPTEPPFAHWDHVHQIAPQHLQQALAAGETNSKQSLIPGGVQIEPQLPTLSLTERRALRDSLSLPSNLPIVLSVGLVNKSHKRMDYIIREMATLPKPRPYLIILGQNDAETPEITSLATSLLGQENYKICAAPRSQVNQYYQAADVFVLASFIEGLPRVLVEALSWGLPCLAHDYDVPRFALGHHGFYADFKQEKALLNLIQYTLNRSNAEESITVKSERHKFAYERFSWASLKLQYVEMIQKCAFS